MTGKRIIVCEDNEFLRKTLVLFMELDGHEVLDFSTADEVLQLSENVLQTIDVLLTDVDMPGTNGLQLSIELKTLYPQLAVLIMSGKWVDLDNIKWLGARFFHKPFRHENLLKAIEVSAPIAMQML